MERDTANEALIPASRDQFHTRRGTMTRQETLAWLEDLLLAGDLTHHHTAAIEAAMTAIKMPVEIQIWPSQPPTTGSKSHLIEVRFTEISIW